MDEMHYQAQLPLAAPQKGSGELALSINNGQMILAIKDAQGGTTQFHLDKQSALDFHEGLERSMFFLRYIS